MMAALIGDGEARDGRGLTGLKWVTLQEVKTPGGSVVEMRSTVVDRMALSP